MSKITCARNWQKANKARKYFHDGAMEFVHDLISGVHERLVAPKIETVEKDGDLIVQCDRGENKRCLCDKENCARIYDDVIDLHVCTLHSRLQNWHRCFCYDKMSVAACFLTLHEPHERKNRHFKGLQEVDSLGLLTILDNCTTETEKYLDRTYLKRAIDIHTSITRNASMETDRTTLFEFLDILIQILQSLNPQTYQQAVESVTKLAQLKVDDSILGENAIKLTNGKHYDPTKELGRGRFAVVYEGTSGTGEAMFRSAVKQILCRDNDKTLSKELSEAIILQVLETKRHPNVVGYYEIFQNDTHLYIFTELYNGTLEDYVKSSFKYLRSGFDATKVNRCLAEGLSFLHSEGVVHRDLKPSNIFIRVDNDRITKVAIGDFGSAKLCRMKFEYSATLSAANVPGTAGYVAPEVWEWYENEDDDDEKKYFTVKSDTYSLGLIFYFSVSNGKHPFGNGSGFRIQTRIQSGECPNLEKASVEYHCLIRKMIKLDIKERMFADQVLKHPALWTSGQILGFFVEKSNYLTDTKGLGIDALKVKLEASEIIRSLGWMENLPTNLREHLCKGRHSFQGKERSVLALLRAIRNTEHHIDDFSELPREKDQRVSVWLKTCPELLMRVYEIFKEYESAI